MVRYELILRRSPKLAVADIPKRMGDLPKELSRGSLQRALEQPDDGPLAIAWGEQRKRLLAIQRRIEIMGGAAELVDHAGPVRQRLTSWADALLEPFRKPERAAANSSRGNLWAWTFASLATASAGFLWWRGEELHVPPWLRTHALQAAGFLSGALLSQLFVRGVRAWRSGQTSRVVAAASILLSLGGLSAASWKAHELGIWQRTAALKAKLTHEQQRKPNMPPFTALLVELERRHQRRELSRALASAEPGPAPQTAATDPNTPNEPAMKPSDQPAPAPAAPEPQPAAPMPQPSASAAQVGSVAARPAHARAAPQAPRRAAPGDPLQALMSQLDGPLRSVEDVNPIHGAAALIGCLLTFACGLWLGRAGRGRRELASALAAPSSRPSAAAAGAATSTAPATPSLPPAANRGSDASVTPDAPPELAEELFDSLQPTAANDTSAAIAAASAQRFSADKPGPMREKITAGAGFAIQEARSTPRRHDARRDD